MRSAFLVLAVAVAVAGIVLFVLARESPSHVTATASDAAVTAVQQPHVPPPAVVRADAAVDAPPGHPPELEALRSSGSDSEPWSGQATNLLRGFDPEARVECYVAGCAATLAFDSDDAYERAVETVRTDETWTGGKKWLSAERTSDRITAVLILYRPD